MITSTAIAIPKAIGKGSAVEVGIGEEVDSGDGDGIIDGDEVGEGVGVGVSADTVKLTTLETLCTPNIFWFPPVGMTQKVTHTNKECVPLGT
jgi:hypothetical protein